MRWVWISVLGLVLVVFSQPGPGGSSKEAGAAVAGAPAPAFELVTFAGEAYNQDSLKGQPTLLVFWASWCLVCQKELPVLGRFYEKDKPTQLRVISIGFSDLRGRIEVMSRRIRSRSFFQPPLTSTTTWHRRSRSPPRRLWFCWMPRGTL